MHMTRLAVKHKKLLKWCKLRLDVILKRLGNSDNYRQATWVGFGCNPGDPPADKGEPQNNCKAATRFNWDVHPISWKLHLPDATYSVLKE